MRGDSRFGVAWFLGLQDILMVDKDHPEGVHLSTPTELNPDCNYITNIAQDEIDILDTSDTIKACLRNEYTYSVRPSSVAIDLGWQTENLSGVDIPENVRLNILKAMRDGYLTAFARADIDPCDSRYAHPGNEFLNDIWEKTMPPPYRSSAWPEIPPSQLRPRDHAWINVKKPLGPDWFIRTLSVNRNQFYHAFLSHPVPVGEWGRGDPSATDQMIVSHLRDDYGVLVRGAFKSPDMRAFVPSCKTDSARDLFIGFEVISLQEEGGKLSIQDWWSGPLEPVDSPYETPEPISLGDGLLLEMIHRSWRRNPCTGYWMACTERLALHGIAESIDSEVTPVLGYGSGRITICTPRDEEAMAKQDQELLETIPALCLQLPLNLHWKGEELAWRMPMLSPVQKVAICNLGLLSEIDQAIDSQQQEGIDTAMDSIETSLTALLSSSTKAQSHECR